MSNETQPINTELAFKRDLATLHVREIGSVAAKYSQRAVYLPPGMLSNMASTFDLEDTSVESFGDGILLTTFEAQTITPREIGDRMQNLARANSKR